MTLKPLQTAKYVGIKWSPDQEFTATLIEPLITPEHKGLFRREGTRAHSRGRAPAQGADRLPPARHVPGQALRQHAASRHGGGRFRLFLRFLRRRPAVFRAGSRWRTLPDHPLYARNQ